METQMDSKALQNDQRHLKVVKNDGKDTQRAPKGSPKGPQRVPKWSQGAQKAAQKAPKGTPKRLPNHSRIRTHI